MNEGLLYELLRGGLITRDDSLMTHDVHGADPAHHWHHPHRADSSGAVRANKICKNQTRQSPSGKD
jgi:hypothetical protein